MSDTEYLYQASGRQYEIVKKTAKLVFYKDPHDSRRSKIVERNRITASVDVMVSYSWYWQRPVYPSEGPMMELRKLEEATKAARAVYDQARKREWEARDRIRAAESVAEHKTPTGAP
jgi:hypothetical protein